MAESRYSQLPGEECPACQFPDWKRVPNDEAGDVNTTSMAVPGLEVLGNGLKGPKLPRPRPKPGGLTRWDPDPAHREGGYRNAEDQGLPGYWTCEDNLMPGETGLCGDCREKQEWVSLAKGDDGEGVTSVTSKEEGKGKECSAEDAQLDRM